MNDVMQQAYDIYLAAVVYQTHVRDNDLAQAMDKYNKACESTHAAQVAFLASHNHKASK